MVVDEMEVPMPAAAVALLHLPDSAILLQTLTGENGGFQFSNNAKTGDYLLKISFIGYENYHQNLVQADFETDTIDLGRVKMTPLSKLLSEALVTALREPVQIRGDTMSFDAKAFPTQANAVAADLVKKLPGIELEKDGSLTAQGEAVQQIMVNGKPFFGNDPQIALQNLTADAIEAIEIYDKRSDQAEFTGIDDGNRRKTINIRLKKDFNKVKTGKFAGGYGTTNRYFGRANYNDFTDTRKWTLLGTANNINRTGFGVEDFTAFTGQNRRRDGGFSQPNLQQNTSKGFQETQSGGINFNGDLSSKTDLNGTYFFNNQTILTDRLFDRQSFLKAGSFFTHTKSINETTNRNHRLSGTLDHKFDSLNSIRATTNLSWTQNWVSLSAQSENLKGDTLLQNRQSRRSYTEGGGLNGSASLLLRRRLSKTGRTASVGLNYSRNESARTVALNSLIHYYDGLGLLRRDDTIAQSDDRDNARNDYSTSLSYTEPLTKKSLLEGSIRLGLAENFSNRSVFDLKRGEPLFDNALSNIYTNDFNYQRYGLHWKLNGGQRYQMTFGGQFQRSILRGVFLTRQESLEQVYRYFLPTARFDYSISKQNRLNFSYETQVNEPTIDQLQPVRDNSDPLNLYIGNKDLRPEYLNRLRFSYSNFNRRSFTFFNANLNGTYTSHKIANMLTIDSALRRTTQPVNTDRAVNLDGHTALGFRFFRNRLRLNWTTNANWQEGIGFINGIKNLTQRLNSSTSFRTEWQMPDTLELSLRAVVRYNQTDYSVQTNLSQWFISYSYEAEMTIALPYQLRLSTNFDYTILTGKAFGQAQGIPLVSIAATKYFDKQRRRELRLTVVDALNRNTGINRFADANYVQEERIRSLGRYALLTFTYSLNPKVEGKKRQRSY